MNKIISCLLLTSVTFFSIAQNKKEQIEGLIYSLDSLKTLYTKTSTAYSDSLNKDRNLISEQQLEIKDQIMQLESSHLQTLSLQEKLIASHVEISALKNEMETLKADQKTSPSDIHYYSFNVNNNENSPLNDIIPTLYKYPEKNTLSQQLQYSKSYSELQECRLWKMDSINYAFVLIKDTKKVANPNPNDGNGDMRDLGVQVTLSCYILKSIDYEFVIDEKWTSSIETCFLELMVKNIDFHITDINKDDKVEIWYVVESYCSLGVEPSKLEIYLYKSGALNKMESVTNWPGQFTDSDVAKLIKDGEDFAINEFDSNFEKLPQEYKTYAIGLRNKNLFGSSGYWR
jgi:hypothetical protein